MMRTDTYENEKYKLNTGHKSLHSNKKPNRRGRFEF